MNSWTRFEKYLITFEVYKRFQRLKSYLIPHKISFKIIYDLKRKTNKNFASKLKLSEKKIKFKYFAKLINLIEII